MNHKALSHPGECFFTSRRVCRILAALLVLCVVVGMTGCQRSSTDPPVESIVFAIDENDLGPRYSNAELGVEFRPPVNWLMLPPDQKEAISQGLLETEVRGPYTLSIQDVFLNTDSLSFAVISLVEAADQPSTSGSESGTSRASESDLQLSEYRDYLLESLTQKAAAQEGEVSVDLIRFQVNGLVIDQFRHLVADRAATTLLFTDKHQDIIQLDYSIPVSAFELEIGKLESSIGTLAILQ